MVINNIHEISAGTLTSVTLDGQKEDRQKKWVSESTGSTENDAVPLPVDKHLSSLKTCSHIFFFIFVCLLRLFFQLKRKQMIKSKMFILMLKIYFYYDQLQQVCCLRWSLPLVDRLVSLQEEMSRVTSAYPKNIVYQPGSASRKIHPEVCFKKGRFQWIPYWCKQHQRTTHKGV